jgi:hypothetical protein
MPALFLSVYFPSPLEGEGGGEGAQRVFQPSNSPKRAYFLHKKDSVKPESLETWDGMDFLLKDVKFVKKSDIIPGSSLMKL